MTTILLKRGKTASVNNYTGPSGELIVDIDKQRIHTQDNKISGGHEVLAADDQVTKLSELTDKNNIWTNANLQLSDLSNDVQMWKKNELTKLSQLNNDVQYKSEYCSYCTYCSNCSRCNDVRCHNVNCYQVKCNNVKCTVTNCTTVRFSYHYND